MSARLEAARRTVQALAQNALAVVDDKAATPAAKKAALDKIEPQIKKWTEEVKALESVDRQYASYGHLSDLNGGTGWYASGDAGHLATRKNLPGPGEAPAFGAAPSLAPSEDQLRELHDAVLSHKSLRIEVDTKGPSADLPASLVPGITGLSHEPTRILDLLPSTSMGTPAVDYLRHTSTTGTAGMVAPGGVKPLVTLVTDKLEARAKKIAVRTTINDEDLADFSAFFSYVNNELGQLVIDQENIQLLAGDGTGENLLGIFSTTGILTRVKAVAPETGIDTLALAANDLRIGLAKVAATVYAMHPTTWTGLRMLKDSTGRYVLGNPAEQDASRLWGVPVVQTTGIAVGTVLASDPGTAARAHIRQGLVIQSDFGTDGFETNRTSLRAEERIALAVSKPSAAIKITGL